MILIPITGAVTRYLTIPYRVQSATEGGKLHLLWTYELDLADESIFQGVSLGTFSVGTFTNIYIKVNAAGTVLAVSPKFLGRLTWNGDLSQKKIEFVLNTVYESDAGEFTCGIDLSIIKGFVVDKLTLNVYGKSISYVCGYFVATALFRGVAIMLSCISIHCM